LKRPKVEVTGRQKPEKKLVAYLLYTFTFGQQNKALAAQAPTAN